MNDYTLKDYYATGTSPRFRFDDSGELIDETEESAAAQPSPVTQPAQPAPAAHQPQTIFEGSMEISALGLVFLGALAISTGVTMLLALFTPYLPSLCAR